MKQFISFYRFCCSDWKFLALVYGLNGASSKFFCIWCYCSKEQINNLDSKLGKFVLKIMYSIYVINLCHHRAVIFLTHTNNLVTFTFCLYQHLYV